MTAEYEEAGTDKVVYEDCSEVLAYTRFPNQTVRRIRASNFIA